MGSLPCNRLDLLGRPRQRQPITASRKGPEWSGKESSRGLSSSWELRLITCLGARKARTTQEPPGKTARGEQVTLDVLAVLVLAVIDVHAAHAQPPTTINRRTSTRSKERTTEDGRALNFAPNWCFGADVVVVECAV